MAGVAIGKILACGRTSVSVAPLQPRSSNLPVTTPFSTPSGAAFEVRQLLRDIGGGKTGETEFRDDPGRSADGEAAGVRPASCHAPPGIGVIVRMQSGTL